MSEHLDHDERRIISDQPDESVTDAEAGTYSTPATAAPPREQAAADAERAKSDMSKGLPTLFASVFGAFVLVAVIAVLLRYVF